MPDSLPGVADRTMSLEANMTGSVPRRPHEVLLCLSCLLFLVAVTPQAWGGTLLTNGHPIHVRFDSDPVEFDTVIAGGKGFNIFVPPGARQLVIEFVTTPSAAMELIAHGTDRGETWGPKVWELGWPTSGMPLALSE